METGNLCRINGNVENTGHVTNLPRGCCVEVPCLVDENGIHPCHLGDLPSQCAALNRTNISVQELAVKAALERERTTALQAVMFDPLTSAMLTPEEIERMVDEEKLHHGLARLDDALAVCPDNHAIGHLCHTRNR